LIPSYCANRSAGNGGDIAIANIVANGTANQSPNYGTGNSPVVSSLARLLDLCLEAILRYGTRISVQH